MNSRTTLILVGLFLIVLGYVYFIELRKTPAELGQPVRPAPRVFDLPSDQVAALELRDLKKAREIRLVRLDQDWQFDKPTKVPADSRRVTEIVAGFAELQAARVFTDVTDVAQYGVLTGTLEARLIMRDSTQYAITIGNKTAAGSSYYAIHTGAKQAPVFIIASRLVDEWLGWFDNPPYQPTPTPTFIPAPSATPTINATPTGLPPTTAPTLAPTTAPSATSTR